MNGWNTSFLLWWIIFRGELLVLGRVSKHPFLCRLPNFFCWRLKHFQSKQHSVMSSSRVCRGYLTKLWRITECSITGEKPCHPLSFKPKKWGWNPEKSPRVEQNLAIFRGPILSMVTVGAYGGTRLEPLKRLHPMPVYWLVHRNFLQKLRFEKTAGTKAPYIWINQPRPFFCVVHL